MQNNGLKKCAVFFDDEAHTYTMNGSQMLSGVTPIVGWLFPRTYEGISEDVLKKAAEAGKLVHLDCQTYDETGVNVNPDGEQLNDYIELTRDYDHVVSEYLVSDEANIASSIDKIYNGRMTNGVILGDIKCTSSLHMENVTVQLSIYAMLFERMNPSVPVESLIAIWLPQHRYGRAKIVEVQRIPSDVCDEIVTAFLQEPWRAEELREKVVSLLSSVPTVADGALVKFRDMELEVARIESQLAELKAREDFLKSGLLKLMQENNKESWTGEHIVLTRKMAYKRQSLDSKKIKEKYPDVYAECVKETTVNESLTIKLK